MIWESNGRYRSPWHQNHSSIGRGRTKYQSPRDLLGRFQIGKYQHPPCTYCLDVGKCQGPALVQTNLYRHICNSDDLREPCICAYIQPGPPLASVPPWGASTPCHLQHVVLLPWIDGCLSACTRIPQADKSNRPRGVRRGLEPPSLMRRLTEISSNLMGRLASCHAMFRAVEHKTRC